jgi:hypothetical protein
MAASLPSWVDDAALESKAYWQPLAEKTPVALNAIASVQKPWLCVQCAQFELWSRRRRWSSYGFKVGCRLLGLQLCEGRDKKPTMGLY